MAGKVAATSQAYYVDIASVPVDFTPEAWEDSHRQYVKDKSSYKVMSSPVVHTSLIAITFTWQEEDMGRHQASHCAQHGSYQQTESPRSVCSEPCPLGYRKAARTGQLVCCFDCVPCSMGEIANQTGSSECIQCPEDLWSDIKREKCIPKVIDFLSFEDSLGSPVTSLSVAALCITISVLCIFLKFRNSPIVKANNRTLSYLLLIALSLSFLCPLIFIGQPRRINCILRQTTFGIIFSICISSILAKTVIVIIAFNARNPASKLRNWVGSKWLPSCIVICGCLFQFIICIIWLLTASPYPQKDKNSEAGRIIYECNEGSATMFYCMLGYMGLLASVCFSLAFLARNLPDRFNETKYITFSMLVFLSVWISFIPAYLSAKGKYMVAVEIFAIIASSAGLISFIFIPKCYIILVQPDMNTREKLIGKASSHRYPFSGAEQEHCLLKYLAQSHTGNKQVIKESNLASQEVAQSNLASQEVAQSNLASQEVAQSNLASQEVAQSNLASQEEAQSNLASQEVAQSNLSSQEVAQSNLASQEEAQSNLASQEVAQSNLASQEVAQSNFASQEVAHWKSIALNLLIFRVIKPRWPVHCLPYNPVWTRYFKQLRSAVETSSSTIPINVEDIDCRMAVDDDEDNIVIVMRQPE
ncbi:vomeronasal type-2 receptor 26-like [Protopterus annectens]|uniref:vomeronasal type-2 receptor 26-like n=1 Tax=Protopterus annectens TaxID=7888 RepID=UPI001CFBA28D|nr:vomeronasal type-2 receptor 26-like [Protopterus annectens]